MQTHQNKIVPSSSTTEKPNTSDNCIPATIQNKVNEKSIKSCKESLNFNSPTIQELLFEKSIPDKSNECPEENLFDPITLADMAPNELSDSVWRLADQTDIDKDNQIFYVTYEDPNLGNKTLKLVNQVVNDFWIFILTSTIRFFLFFFVEFVW